MARRPWSKQSDDDRRRKARSDPRQVSLFGRFHTFELIEQSEARAERAAYYLQKWGPRKGPQSVSLDSDLEA